MSLVWAKKKFVELNLLGETGFAKCNLLKKYLGHNILYCRILKNLIVQIGYVSISRICYLMELLKVEVMN